MNKYCHQIEEVDLPSFIKICKDFEIVPKIVSIQHAYILFTKLLPIYASSQIIDGTDDILGASLYTCKRLTLDSHLLVYAMYAIAISVNYQHLEVSL